MRPPYEVLEHTADIGLRARGATLEEAFLNMARGMMSLVIQDAKSVSPAEEREVEATAPTLEGLLVAWLSEFVYLIDAERFLPAEICVPAVSRERAAAVAAEGGETSRWIARGRVRGERLDPARHALVMEIKGVSYHLLEIRRVGGERGDDPKGRDTGTEAGGWTAQAIFDV